MARPNKNRRVCEIPQIRCFGPKPSRRPSDSINLTVDEYEVVRLIDYEGLNQEEAASQMGVARPTIQRVYNNARKKLALMMVEGKEILIEGGNYTVCDGNYFGPGCRGGRGRGRCGK